MAEKIVVLNSGGFDSIVLLHYLSMLDERELDIHSLHFLYGARNEKQQLECVKKVTEKLNLETTIVELPRFSWTKSAFYSGGGENLYVEGRNLVFLSYAMSYAESIGAKVIYWACLKSLGYSDTSKDFLEKVNQIAELSGIKIIAPFAENTKVDLLQFATMCGIGYNEFFSCDTPIDGNPCHKCADCELLDSFYKNDMPIKEFIRNNCTYTEEFKRLFKVQPIKEMRVLINNDCQLKCKHCFYGFKEMISPKLTVEEMKNAIRQAAELGVKNFHFSGKEPLFDETIFEYAKFIRECYPNCTFDVVTNGITIPWYATRLKVSGFQKVFLSVDSNEGIRNVKNSYVYSALQSLKENNLDVEIFVDIHKDNFNLIYDILTSAKRYIKSAYVRTIESIGNASNFELLEPEKIEIAFRQALDFARENPQINVTFNLNSEYADIMRKSEETLGAVLWELEESFMCHYIYSNFIVFGEVYCERYEGTITITPDGYILGCATEVCHSDYDKISVGNIKDKSLKELIELGKIKSLTEQERVCGSGENFCLKKCPHTCV